MSPRAGADVLLEDVEWHQRAARRAVGWACAGLLVGSPMIGRLLIGLQAARDEVDPWGPLDALIILAGLAFWGGAVWLLVRADVHGRTAVEIARWQIRDVDGSRVASIELHGRARGARGMRTWIAQRHATVVPIAALAPRDRGAQLLIAARSRPGTEQERRASFGEGIATGYAQGVRRARRTAAVLGGAELIVGGVAVAGFVWGGGSAALFRSSAVAFVVLVVSSPIIGRAERGGPNGVRALAAGMLPSLRSRDGRLDVNQVAAMIRKPRLYDLWAELHPFPRAALGSQRGSAFGRDLGASRAKMPRCRT
ncbi:MULTISPECIES: hypothetical protein [unclassified Microbacterium]|uniref:hypothetical protein n=1 Tax=unclassified Microbacterium TaxID=2609290 RepID=UPI00364D3723